MTFYFNNKFLKSVLTLLIFTFLFQQAAWAGLHEFHSLRARAFRDRSRSPNPRLRFTKDPLQKRPHSARRRATEAIMASEKIDRQSVHTILYTAALNLDGRTVRELFEIFPKAEKLIFIDPAYAGLAKVTPLLVVRALEVAGLSYVNEWTYEGALGKGGRLIANMTTLSGADVEVSFYAEDYYTFTLPQHRRGVDANIVKYPGSTGEMSHDDKFYNKVVRDTAEDGYVLVKHAKLPLDPAGKGLTLLERTEEKSAGPRTFVSFDDWAVYRKNEPSLNIADRRRIADQMRYEVSMIRKKLIRAFKRQGVYSVPDGDLWQTASILAIEILRREMDDRDLVFIIQQMLGMNLYLAEETVRYARRRLYEIPPAAALMASQSTASYDRYLLEKRLEQIRVIVSAI